MKTERLPVRICDCGNELQCKIGNICIIFVSIFILNVFFYNNEE